MKIEGLQEFIAGLNNLESNLAKDMKIWMDALGMMFLDEVQREIIRSQTVDTRRLLNSFARGDSDNIWKVTSGGLRLEIGTNVKYATYANSGHMQTRRFVPGNWVGPRFEYNPGAGTGMMLSARWVEGSHYFDTANRIFKRMFDKALDKKLKETFDRSFGGR